MLLVKIFAGNSSSSGFGRSAIVICPLEIIIQDQVLEAQSIGVTACSLSAKEVVKCARIHRNFCLQRQRTFRKPVQNSKYRRCSDWFIFPPKSWGRNVTFNGILPDYPSLDPVPSPSLPFPKPKKACNAGKELVGI